MKDAIKGKGKRGRKRKSAALEADEPEPEVARLMYTPVPWRAPIARMIKAAYQNPSLKLGHTNTQPSSSTNNQDSESLLAPFIQTLRQGNCIRDRERKQCPSIV